MKTLKRSNKGSMGGREPSVLDYFSKSKRKKASKPQTTLSFGTPATATLAEDDLYQSETPVSVLNDEVLSETSIDATSLRGSTREISNDAHASEERTPEGSSSATPDHEPNTPPSPPTPATCVPDQPDRNPGEWGSAMKSARPSETPPSHDTYMTTPSSPPTPAGTTWGDCPISGGKKKVSNAKRDNPRDGSSDVTGNYVDTPKSLLDTNDTPAQNCKQVKGQSVNMDTPSSAGTHTSSQLDGFLRTYTASPSNSSKISPKTRKVDGSLPSKRPHKQQKQSTKQLFLDFGQHSFGKQTICSICGMLRVHGMAEDDAQHAKICKEYKEGVTCFGWKNERRVATFELDDRILEVRPEDAPQHRKKITEVKTIVDAELGFARKSHEEAESAVPHMTSYIYISKKRVVGLLMVKRIRRAYELLPSKEGTHDKQNGNADNNASSISRSLEPSKALLGIHQIWVHNSQRARGIASKLVTAARDHAIFGMMIPLELVAFSSPTDEGLRFAKRYLGSKRPLIYDIH